MSDDNEWLNTINRCFACLVYLPSLERGSRLLVSNSLDSIAALKENKAFSLQFLRFRERTLVTNNWNRLLLPKICCIAHELSSPLLYLLQEAKKEKNKKKQRRRGEKKQPAGDVKQGRQKTVCGWEKYNKIHHA